MSIGEWAGLIAVAITIIGALITVGVYKQRMVDAEKASEKSDQRFERLAEKMNGLPARVSALELEVGFGKDWRHDVAVPMFSRLQIVEIEVKHLKEAKH